MSYTCSWYLSLSFSLFYISQLLWLCDHPSIPFSQVIWSVLLLATRCGF